MTDVERDDCYKEIARNTESLKKLFEKHRLHEALDEKENEPRFPAIRKAKRVFSTSNVPEIERHTTLCKTVKTVLMLFISTILFSFQGIFR